MANAEILKLSGYEAERYFEELRKRTRIKVVGHEWHNPKRLKWLTYCDGCGLVFARNKLTQKAIRLGCRRGFVE